MGTWNPWRGCHRYSTGCKYCYIHKGDSKKGIDTNIVTKTEKFYAPFEKAKNGAYKMKSGQTVYVCFSSDFLIEDADKWRTECWEMIRERALVCERRGRIGEIFSPIVFRIAVKGAIERNYSRFIRSSLLR